MMPHPFRALTVASAVVLFSACGRGAASEWSGELAATEIPSPAPVHSAEPNLAVGPDGAVYLTWTERVEYGGHALRFAVLRGDAWSEPRTIARGEDWFVNWADFPALTVFPDGALAAHWLRKSGPGTYAYDVLVSRSTDGGETWSEAVIPHRDGTQTEHGFVSHWAAGGDTLSAVWLDGRKFAGAEMHGQHGEMMLMHARIPAEWEPGEEEVLDDLVCECCQTGMAMTSRGPLVVYRDRTREEVRDIYVVRHVDGAWTAPRPVHSDGWVMPACPVNGPYAAADGDRVAVAWFTGEGDDPRVQVAFSDDAGATFGPAHRVDEGETLGRVSVQLLPDGAALVTWLDRAGDNDAAVRMRRVERGGRLGELATVGLTTAARGSGFPRVARTGDRLLFAWTVPGDTLQIRMAEARLGGAR